MNPDDAAIFRCARLLLLLDLVRDDAPGGLDAERLGVYDFLASHPLLLARSDGDPDRTALRLAGFDDRAIGYASPAHRLATAQQRLGRDLTMLVGEGLIAMTVSGRIRYRVTEKGRAAASGLNATYARSYTTAARVVVRRLRRLSGRRLRETLRRCTAASPGHPAFSDLSETTGVNETTDVSETADVSETIDVNQTTDANETTDVNASTDSEDPT